MKFLSSILTAVCLLLTPHKAFGNTAYPEAVSETQSDGTPIELFINGDEFDNFYTDLQGYTVVQNYRGDYVYARQNPQGFVIPGGTRVDSSSSVPPGIVKKLRPSPAARKIECKGMLCGDIRSHGDERRLEESRQLVQTTGGTLKNLVVLIRFADHDTRTLPSQTQIETLMNNRGPDLICPTGSVWNIFDESSYGKLDVYSTVSPWVTVPNTETYYANGNSGLTTRTHDLIRDALTLVDLVMDFSQFDTENDGVGDGTIDAITFLHSGYAAEFGGTDEYGVSLSDRMWSHKWAIYSGTGRWFSNEDVSVYDYNIGPAVYGTSGSTIGRIGVIGHELGHFLGLPDLYDGSGGSGIGSFGLMANSW
jgi:M6 family metalloprotease-like protein